MKNSFIILLLIVFGLIVGWFFPVFAEPLSIPGSQILQDPSIVVTSPGNDSDSITVIRSFGFKILAFLKMFISGIALIYLVVIGAYMVVYSENEERIKTQRKQIIYALIGFLFLNIPGVVYEVIAPSQQGGGTLDMNPNWNDSTSANSFWSTSGLEDFILGPDNSVVAFLRVFIFGVAVVMFTWGLFRLIVSAGDDEARKQGKNRIIYGILGLIFLGFIEGWSRMVAGGNFVGTVGETVNNFGSQLFGIAIFFAGPIAVFFLIWGAYYYITSAGDEERVKKGKAIIVNTFIATLILIASLSFMTDLINFNFSNNVVKESGLK